MLFLPLDGLSEYLVQKTHAGHNCPFGPLTMPGGTSSSLSLDSLSDDVDDFDDKSTGWLAELTTLGLGLDVTVLLLLMLPECEVE